MKPAALPMHFQQAVCVANTNYVSEDMDGRTQGKFTSS